MIAFTINSVRSPLHISNLFHSFIPHSTPHPPPAPQRERETHVGYALLLKDEATWEGVHVVYIKVNGGVL